MERSPMIENSYRYETLPADLKQPEQELWTFVSSVLQSQPLRLILLLKIVDSVFINVTVEPGKVGEGSLENRLLSLHARDAETFTSSYNVAINELLNLCRQTYGTAAPQFAKNLRLWSSRDGPHIEEEIDYVLLPNLQGATDIFETNLSLPPFIPSNRLQSIVQPGSYFLPSTRLVCHEGSEYVAKGPIYPTRIYYDYQEIRNLLSLPRHPNILPPPCALVTVSEIDERICGFLSPHYRNGNLDIYARKLRSKGTLTLEKLYKWFGQLVDAVKFLAWNETWHGDIKPDNIVIDDNENAVLIDFARAFTTSATASPEARKYSSTNAPCRTSVGIPEDWPLQTVVLSEIYSIGRTMYLVCEGISMLDIYQDKGWVNDECDFWTEFGHDTMTPNHLQSVIAQCVAVDPADRITLEELSNILSVGNLVHCSRLLEKTSA